MEITHNCEEKGHCGHPSGHGVTYGTGTSGYDQIVCCHCGVQTTLPWHTESREVVGHGPCYWVKLKVYATVTGWRISSGREA